MSKSRPGMTMVELLVVISIIAILAAVAIPGMTRLGLFARNELPSTAQELLALLQAAQVHAATYNVRTAVVYNLDNWVAPLSPDDVNPALPNPVQDSITGFPARVITSACIMVQGADDAVGLWYDSTRTAYYLPVSEFYGEFRPFPGRMTVLLRDPVDLQVTSGPLYTDLHARYEPASHGGLSSLGMAYVWTFIGETGPFAEEGSEAYEEPIRQAFPAHVFDPGGGLVTSGGKERYTMMVSASPDEAADERLVNGNNPNYIDYIDGEPILNILHILIEVYRSTGRVKIAS